jgi:Carbonic anhydrase
MAGPDRDRLMADRPPITPHEALDLLKEGNRRFLADAPHNPSMDRLHRLHLAAAQGPFAAYLSFSDSRVPPELLFGRGLGELFIVRNAGNTLCATALRQSGIRGHPIAGAANLGDGARSLRRNPVGRSGRPGTGRLCRQCLESAAILAPSSA